MAARITDGSSSTGESTYNTDTNYQTKTSFSRTPTANSTAIVIYSCLIAGSSTLYQSKWRLYNATAATTQCEGFYEPRDSQDYVRCFGYSIETFGASPASQTWQLDYGTTNTSGTVSIKQAHLTYIELHADDFSEVADGPHTVTDTNYVTGVTMTETFVNGEDYYVLAMAETSVSTTTALSTIEAQYDGGTVYGQSIRDHTNTSEFTPWAALFKITGDGTSNNIIIRSKSSSTSDVAFRRARIVAFRADAIEASFYDEARARTTTTSTTYQDKVTSTHTLANVEHIVIAAGVLDSSTTQQGYSQLDEDGSSLGEHTHEANTGGETGGAWTPVLAYRKTFTAASHTLKTQFKSETSSTIGLKESAILIMQTGAASVTPVVAGPMQVLGSQFTVNYGGQGFIDPTIQKLH